MSSAYPLDGTHAVQTEKRTDVEQRSELTDPIVVPV